MAVHHPRARRRSGAPSVPAAPRRAAVACALLAAPVLATGGCAQLENKSLSSQEVVVHFQLDASQALHRAARANCTGFPGTRAEPMGHSTLQSELTANVRFRVDKANDVQLMKLYHCLSKQKGVLGVDMPSDM